MISPYRGKQTADGNYLWSDGFDHSAMMSLMEPYITAYKAGQKEVTVTKNRLVYWYRPTLKSAMWISRSPWYFDFELTHSVLGVMRPIQSIPSR